MVIRWVKCDRDLKPSQILCRRRGDDVDLSKSEVLLAFGVLGFRTAKDIAYFLDNILKVIIVILVFILLLVIAIHGCHCESFQTEALFCLVNVFVQYARAIQQVLE